MYFQKLLIVTLIAVQTYLINGSTSTVSNTAVPFLSANDKQSENTFSSTSTVKFLQSELASCSAAQQSVVNFLRSKRVAIGSTPGSLLRSKSTKEGVRSRIAISTQDNNIECRVALGKAPIGSKCVAPCGCSGSQKWVQFAELNKLRRKDPTQWITCRTCQQNFDYRSFEVFGGVPAGLLGFILDNRSVARTAILALTCVVLYVISAPLWIARLLTSRMFWMKFPQWSKLAHLPLPLKFWILKLAVQFAGERYLQWERDVLVCGLAELEAQYIEDGLPVPTAADDDEVASSGVQEGSDGIESEASGYDS